MTVDQHLRSSIPPLSEPPDTTTAPAPRIRRVRYEPDLRICCKGDREAPWRGPVTTEVPDDPAARAAAQQLLLLIAQVLNRRRAATHLVEVAAPEVVRYVRAVTPLRGLVQVTSLHLRMPRSGAAEVVAVCQFSTRCHRVIAARLDEHPRAGWRCTALRLL